MTSPAIDIDKYLRIINLRVHLALELLKKCGSEDQVARYARGAMTVDELLTIARAELFAPFTGLDLKRFAKSHDIERMHRSLRHGDGCPERGRDDSETYDTSIVESDNRKVLVNASQRRNADLLFAAVAKAKAHEWLDRRHLLDADAEPIRVDLVMHYVACKVCLRDMSVVVAKVSITWSEHTLVREWVL